jgi:Non-ribosomal peptide synthetase modules and related proteins
MTMTATLAALLHRYSGQRDLRIGAPVANRIRPESEGLIGAFLNTQVLRCELDGQMTAAALLDQVRQAAIEGQSHQDLPFDQLVEALQPPRSSAYNPLFQVMCNVQRWAFQQSRSWPACRWITWSTTPAPPSSTCTWKSPTSMAAWAAA